MPTIKEQLDAIDRELLELITATNKLYAKKAGLRLYQYECSHKFSKALKGYEHEGSQCELCGINQVHAESYGIGAQYK